MRRNLIIFASFFLLSFFIFGNNVDLFFAQDDFILIDKFSQHSIGGDIRNIFSIQETHFRPIHNAYFLLLGNLAGKNYALYHLASIFIHAMAGYLVFQIAKEFYKNIVPAFFASFFYVVNSSHFVSLFWISGNAVEIGFCFFCISLLMSIKRKLKLSLAFFLLSLLASESFFVGGLILIAYELMLNGKFKINFVIFRLTVITFLLATLRFVYLTPKNIYDTYQLEVSLNTFSVIKYYFFKILGFAEFSGDFLVSLFLIVVYGILVKRIIDADLDIKKSAFFILIIVMGLFPFILLPYHLSPHYMNLSIFGFSMLLAVAINKRSKTNYLICLILVLISMFNVSGYSQNHWVVVKSRIAEAYIRQIESAEDQPEEGSTMVFGDNRISSSLDAYLALGGGKAIDFWFKGKNYKYCFQEFDECNSLP